jgi:4-amino-4-deoxy-L-arabinose transferase-like glycosyltransferase
VLVGLAARRTAGPAAGRIAALAAALYPPLVWTTAYAFSETLFVTLALCSLLAIWRAIDEGRDKPVWPVFIAGVFAGAATLTRPATLVFLGLAGLWFIARRRPAALLALAAGALLVVAPWTARNYAVHGRFVLVAAEGGVTFWTGNHPLAIGEGDMAANPAIKRAFLEFEARHPGRTNEEIERLYYQEAFRFIRESPGEWIWLVVRKAFYTVVPVGPSYRLHSMRYLVLSVASYLVILSFGIAGFVRLLRGGSPPITLGIFLASAVVVSLAFFPQERFRIPIIDPVLLVWASAWMAMKGRGPVAAAIDRPEPEAAS